MEAAATAHHFFSDLADVDVVDRDGAPVGILYDLALTAAPREGSERYPRAASIVARRGFLRREYADIPSSAIEKVGLHIHLRVAGAELVFTPIVPAHEFSLVRDILDQQVVDTTGQKVIRVNDVKLLQIGEDLRLSHVDVGLRGIVRRLGWQWWVDPFVETFLARTEYLKDTLIPWNYIQPLAITAKGTLKLTVDQRQLSLIPHADFADMMHNMDIYQRLALFKSIAVDVRPKVFSDLEIDSQKELLENLDLKEAAELLSRVPADVTTDLLEELPRPVANSLLALMETTTARRLSALLGYTSDSAGGLMNTDVVTLSVTARVGGVLERVRQLGDALETIEHVFLIDDANRLQAQIPLKRLLTAAPEEAASRYAYPKPIYVRAKDSLREVAYVMEKYKVPVIPVVDNGRDRKLQGVITLDDILTKMIPLAWRRRPKRPPTAAEQALIPSAPSGDAPPAASAPPTETKP